jgi:hypothetical protein
VLQPGWLAVGSAFAMCCVYGLDNPTHCGIETPLILPACSHCRVIGSAECVSSVFVSLTIVLHLLLPFICLHLCTCGCTATADTEPAPTAASPAGPYHSSVAPKGPHVRGTHVTAIAHSGSTMGRADSLPDVLPVSGDQLHNADSSADLGPAAAAAGSIEAGTAAKAAGLGKQLSVRHVPHADLKQFMASAHNRPYTGGVVLLEGLWQMAVLTYA